MGQANSTGELVVVFASLLALACSHERVDLGGTGAGGSAPSLDDGSPSRMTPAMPMQAPFRAPTVRTGSTVPSGPTVMIPGSAAREPSPLVELSPQAEPVAPISGGTLAVAADGSVAVAADPDRDAVFLVDLASDTVRTIKLPDDSEPGRVVLDDRGHAHVVLRNAGKLARIDLDSAQLRLSESICQYPRGAAYSGTTGNLHVACADGQVVQVHSSNYELGTRESHAIDLRDVVFIENDVRLVSRFRSAGLLVPSPSGDVEHTPGQIAWPLIDFVQSPDTMPATVQTQASFAFRTVRDPLGSIWMLHELAQLDMLKDDDYSGKNTGCGPVVHPALTRFEVSASGVEPVYRNSLHLNGASSPVVDAAFSPNGQWLAVASPSAYAQRRPSAQVHSLASLEMQGQTMTVENLGGSVLLPCTAPSFVGLSYESQAVAVAFDGASNLYVQNRVPARLDFIRVVPSNASTGDITVATSDERRIRLSDPPLQDLGHEWFHGELGQTRLSCAACHAEGLDDAQTWLTSAGPRRTPSLRGGLQDTAPFGWTGEHSNLNGALTEHIEGRFSVHELSAEPINAIGAWLAKLPALSLQASDVSAADSGKLLFESPELGCTNCHNGPKLTNNQSVDVGTGGAFQVPSLVGLSLRAPYMHDGCAKDLQALIEQPNCARSGHAQLASLTAEQAASLFAYLVSL